VISMKVCKNEPNERCESNSDDFDLEPSVENSFGSYGEFTLVGKGDVTNEFCGKFYGYIGCARTELHNKKIFLKRKGEVSLHDCKNKVFVQRVYNSCDKPSCPVCYKHGWAVRQAKRIEARLKEASKRFGLVEHIVASVPTRDYGLNVKALRAKAVKILRRRGVIGGTLIFHGFRYNVRRGWYWSPHFHCLGFILGGYRCRGCMKSCVGCNGFEARTRQEFEKDGYIVKVLGKRKTVAGTAWYQLNHASVKKGVKRFHVATWFGSCSYRKLKVTYEVKKRVCPICQHGLKPLRYSGNNKRLVADLFSVYNPDVERSSFEDLEENGVRVWFEDERFA
jgi:hypothetical protein